MPLTTACEPNHDMVRLRTSTNETVRYTIEADDGVVFELEDQDGNMLLSNDTTARTCTWPEHPDAAPDTTSVTHSLAIEFGEAAELRWRVERLAADGSLLATVKDCRYNNSGGTEEHFDALRIFLV
jgi:hypothetical protein